MTESKTTEELYQRIRALRSQEDLPTQFIRLEQALATATTDLYWAKHDRDAFRKALTELAGGGMMWVGPVLYCAYCPNTAEHSYLEHADGCVLVPAQALLKEVQDAG